MQVNSCFTALFFIQKSNLHLYCKYSDTCDINFFSFNKKKSDKTSKHTRSKELELSQHLIHPEMRVSMRSTFTEGRTRQLSELELGRTETQFS